MSNTLQTKFKDCIFLLFVSPRKPCLWFRVSSSITNVAPVLTGIFSGFLFPYISGIFSSFFVLFFMVYRYERCVVWKSYLYWKNSATGPDLTLYFASSILLFIQIEIGTFRKGNVDFDFKCIKICIKMTLFFMFY